MSERERWIIYPLLFFALGAAVRDKILHRINAKEVYCESLKIVDQQDPLGKAFVELSIERINPTDPQQLVSQHGRLRIINDEGKEVCQMDSNSLQLVSRKGPDKQAFAELSIRNSKPEGPTEATEQVSVLRLVNSEGNEVCQMDSNSLQLVSQPEEGKQAFAELRIKKSKPGDPMAMADQVGMLRLVDSEGRVVCGLDENAILQRVISKQLDIVDAEYSRRVVVTTEQSPAINTPVEEQTVTTQGVIWLNNQRMGLKIAPPAAPKPKANLMPSTAL